MKATLKGRYEAGKSSGAATLALNTGELRLKATLTDATVTKGPSLNGLALSLEKPGSFTIGYNFPKMDLRFVFMNSARVMGKQVNMTYTHALGDKRTAVDGTAVFDPASKVTGSYALGSGGCKVKYVYSHGEERRLVMEPCYDFARNAWDFTISRKFGGGDLVRATYQTSSNVLGVEWNRDSKVNGSFKISTSFNLAEQNMVPKLMAESTWNYEI